MDCRRGVPDTRKTWDPCFTRTGSSYVKTEIVYEIYSRRGARKRLSVGHEGVGERTMQKEVVYGGRLYGDDNGQTSK